MFFNLLPIEIGVIISNSLHREDQFALSYVNTTCYKASNHPMSDLLAYKLKKAVLANDLVKARQLLSIGANASHIYSGRDVPVCSIEPYLAGMPRNLLLITLYKDLPEMAALLLEFKADAKKFRSSIGNPLLLEAAVLGRVKIAKLLIDNGAEIKALNRHGQTPADSIKSFGYTQGDEFTPPLMRALRHSLETNTDWEKAIAAEDAKNAFYEKIKQEREQLLMNNNT